jgi:hypothetical protein
MFARRFEIASAASHIVFRARKAFAGLLPTFDEPRSPPYRRLGRPRRFHFFGSHDETIHSVVLK